MNTPKISRTQIRKRHPALKRKNNRQLDGATSSLPSFYWGLYIYTSKLALERSNSGVNEILNGLDKPAQEGLVDYFETMLADIKERLAKL